MKQKLLSLLFMLAFSFSGIYFAQAQPCMSNHVVVNPTFSLGLTGWTQYGAFNGMVLPIQMGCIDTTLVLQATNNSTSGVSQQVVIHKDTCYKLCYCIMSPNTGGNSRVVVALTNSTVSPAQLLSGSFTPAQAQILDSYVITTNFAPYTRCQNAVKATGNFSRFVIINQTIGNIGSDIRIDNVCLSSRLPCQSSYCDSTNASFGYSSIGLAAQFTDFSTSNLPITSWSWNFGDPASGANNTSNLQNPVHTFTAPGWYQVCLAITAGIPGTVPCYDTICRDIYVPLGSPCDSTVANFSYTATGQTVQFNDLSTSAVNYPISSWSWNFGDPPSGPNNTSTLQNPQHVFTTPGWFLVCLYITAGNPTMLCHDTICMDVFVPASTPCDSVAANFTYTNTGLTANFTDVTNLPMGAVVSSWSWNFGDPPSGVNNTSVLQNPSHTYPAPGWYIVCMYINVVLSDGTPCADTICKDIFIGGSTGNPCDSLSAWFSSTGNMTVNFNDLTTLGGGMILSGWSWDFGDPASGVFNTSNQQNPAHTFTAPGVYIVCLMVSGYLPGTNIKCYDTICRDIVVTQAYTPTNKFDAETLKLAPNPSDGSFRLIHPGYTITRIQVMDAIGRIVYDKPYSDTYITLPGYCQSGFYTVRIETNQKSITRRLIIDKK